jgi:putative FmdB family regulatory protein
MPSYDYVCENCGKKIEVFHSMSENPQYVCEHCGAVLVRKVSGGTATLYKCSGFTQYKGRNGQ